MDTLRKQIEEIINGLMTSHDDVEENTCEVTETATEYLAYIDSIRFIELITEIENVFDIEIQNEDLVQENIKELDVFVAMVGKYLK